MSKAIKVYKKSLVSLLYTLLCSLSLGCADAMIDLDQDDDESKGNHSRNDHNNEAGETPATPKEKLDRCRKILGVKPGATLEDLKTARNKAQKKAHPDKVEKDANSQQEAHRKATAINDAYTILKEALNIT